MLDQSPNARLKRHHQLMNNAILQLSNYYRYPNKYHLQYSL